MVILQKATEEELFRLLQLFPATSLKTVWESEKVHTKEAMCRAAAKERDIEKIVTFIQKNFSQCRMHVYAVTLPDPPTDPLGAITDVEVVDEAKDGAKLLIAKASFVVILQDSLKRETVNLLWPMRYAIVEKHPVLSLVVLERKPGAIFEEGVSVVSRSLDEKIITKQLRGLGVGATDLHKGMKALWDADYMDAFRVKFQSPDSTVDETMNEEMGIKATKPERYEELKSAKMFMSYFRLLDDSVKTIGDFTIDPSRGYIRFPRYTEAAGNADEVVRALLAKN